MRFAILSVLALALVPSFLHSAEKPSSKSVKDTLENATTFELYSLDPAKEDDQGFHGRMVLGKTLVKDAETREALVRSLYKALADTDSRPARCFVPRHGIRAMHKGQTVDVVICFQCYQAKFIVKQQEQTETLSRIAEGLFDKVLKEAGVPLADKAKE